MARPSKKQQQTKKGPRGKKARAKLKLERQWGEEGSYQVKPARGGGGENARKKRRTATSSVDQPSPYLENNRQEKIPGNKKRKRRSGGEKEPSKAFEDLLSSLQNKVSGNEYSDDEEVLVSESYGQGNINQHMIDSDDKNQIEEELLPELPDLFSQRYSQTLPEDEKLKFEVLSEIQATEKVSSKGEDQIIDYTISSKWLRANHFDNVSSTDEWKKLSRSCFEYQSKIFQSSVPMKDIIKSTPVHTHVYPAVAQYLDTLWTVPENPDRMLAMHVLHHVYTSRHCIDMNNRKCDSGESVTLRDQGFTRPTVLVLLPTRSCCYEFCHLLYNLLGQEEEENSEYVERFRKEFGPLDIEPDEDLDEKVKLHRKKTLRQKGREWNGLFGDGVNDDDDFKIGLALHTSKKSTHTSLKVYTDFFKSDIIVASPLGLKISIDNKEDYDFLSSIEICLLLRSEVLLMQNWDHVNEVMAKINQQPRHSNDTDFSRVREHLLAGQAENWRQLIISSSFLDPAILSTFQKFAKSVSGLVRVRRKIGAADSAVSSVLLPTPQAFIRVNASSLSKASEERFNFFRDKILSKILETKQKHTMIYIPSYFDFVTIRNYLLKRELAFVSVTEYSRTTEVGRGRARFLQGRKPIMLYTGRAHFFHRHFIKGVRHLVFFGLPEDPIFYSELVNRLNEGLDDDVDTSNSLVIFNKYDSFSLERVVGTDNSKRMVNGEKKSFLFTS